jgi:hypothetical protein
MKKLLLICCSVSLFILIACNKEVTLITKDSINGVVQKGPFLNGSSICIYELTENYTMTGRNYTAQIADNSGLFELKDISLESPYVLLKADGFYFNEITGQPSAAPVTLYAMTDITDKTTVNVNVLSHLEKSRLEYLLSGGSSFSEAKEQAETEVMKIFSINKPDIADFDLLNIAAEGNDNAVLLAVSLITQGFRTESELSDLLANISTDIRQDGVLNSESLGSLLINDVRLLDLSKTRTNIETRYNTLGMNVSLPEFEDYVKLFLDNTAFEITNHIEYPEFSNYGENILFGDKKVFGPNTSMAAYLPKGTSLKVILKNGGWWLQSLPNGPINWTVSYYDFDLQQQTFTAVESGKGCDLIFTFDSGSPVAEFYENNATIPTRVKELR